MIYHEGVGAIQPGESMMDAFDSTASSAYRFPLRPPGLTDALIFAVVAVAGLLIFFASSPGLSERLFGEAFPTLPVWGAEWWFLNIAPGVALRCAVAALAGCLFPRAFYLWGLALVAHTPLTTYLGYRLATNAGYEIVPDEPGAIINYAIFQALLVIPVLVAYTSASGIGALLRYLANRRRDG